VVIKDSEEESEDESEDEEATPGPVGKAQRSVFSAPWLRCPQLIVNFRAAHKKKTEETKLDSEINDLLESDEEPQDSILGSDEED